jgi:hypothetical protein
LVNDIGRFSGEEIVPDDTEVITVDADRAWTVIKTG